MGKIETMTLNQAATYLRAAGLSISNGVLADGIEAGVYPFAVCIDTGESRVFQIFKRLLDEWIDARVCEEEASG